MGCEFNFLTSITTKRFSFALSETKYASNLPAFKYFEPFFIQRNFSYVTRFTLSHCRQDAHKTNQNTDIQLCEIFFHVAFCCASLTLRCTFSVHNSQGSKGDGADCENTDSQVLLPFCFLILTQRLCNFFH